MDEWKDKREDVEVQVLGDHAVLQQLLHARQTDPLQDLGLPLQRANQHRNECVLLRLKDAFGNGSHCCD